jgi:hypothetical protein
LELSELRDYRPAIPMTSAQLVRIGDNCSNWSSLYIVEHLRDEGASRPPQDLALASDGPVNDT